MEDRIYHELSPTNVHQSRKTKLLSSMLITLNDNQFRVFSTVNNLTYFLCKAVDDISNNCKKKTAGK